MPILPILTTIVALMAAQPASLDCAFQKGASWNKGSSDVSAIVCSGRAGFFVPSALYRTLRDPSRSRVYKLLEEELRLADKEIESLRKANESLDFALAAVKRATDRYEKSWRDAEDDARQARQDAREAAEGSWDWESFLWFLGGAGVVVLSVWGVSELVPDRVLNPG